MGVGASAAGGCTVGHGMVQTSLFSYQGCVARLFIPIGIWAAAKLCLKPTDAVPGQSAQPTQNTPKADAVPPVAAPAEAPAEAADLQSAGAQYGFQTTGVALLERP